MEFEILPWPGTALGAGAVFPEHVLNQVLAVTDVAAAVNAVFFFGNGHARMLTRRTDIRLQELARSSSRQRTEGV
jgi:hypothetical protein